MSMRTEQEVRRVREIFRGELPAGADPLEAMSERELADRIADFASWVLGEPSTLGVALIITATEDARERKEAQDYGRRTTQ